MLRQENSDFSPKERLIRVCFSELFDELEQLENCLSINLIHFEDISYCLKFYITQIKDLGLHQQEFFVEYPYGKLENFLKRFEEELPVPIPNHIDSP